jgi:hypothetical protein
LSDFTNINVRIKEGKWCIYLEQKERGLKPFQ